MPKVEEFVNYIGKNEGEKILSTYGEIPNELGVISGPVEFNIKDSHRYLHVPVEKLLTFKDSNWSENGEGSGVYINQDIFSYPKHGFFGSISIKIKDLSGKVIRSRGRYWETDHSEEMYIGGPGPRETGIYVGDSFVKRELERKRKAVIPQKKVELTYHMPEL